MSLDIRATTLNSTDILHELVYQSLDKIIGTPHTVIARELPVKPGHFILATDGQGQTILISFDISDGGRALLAGLEALQQLSENRAWLYKLYPALFDESARHKRALRIDELLLAVVAPKLPPGHHYLRRAMHQLRLFTFRPLSISNEAGLYIESYPNITAEQTPQDDHNRFRSGLAELNTGEEDYFNSLNLPL